MTLLSLRHDICQKVNNDNINDRTINECTRESCECPIESDRIQRYNKYIHDIHRHGQPAQMARMPSLK